MSFPLYCPNGHLLQGDPSTIGQSCQCPYCGTAFVVSQPEPPADAELPFAELVAEKPDDPIPLPFDPNEPRSLPFDLSDGLPTSPESPPLISIPGINAPLAETPFPAAPEAGRWADGPARAQALSNGAPIPNLQEEARAKPIHIPCPGGHPLEVTREMLGEEAECPLCGKRFALRHDRSLEYRQRQASLQQKEDEHAGRVWLAWAIAVTITVLGGLIVLARAIK
jgi:uncharacterized Zn-finger protein